VSFLVVSPLDAIAETAAQHRAGSMVSLLAEGQDFHRPGLIPKDRHLVLGLNDIVADQAGLVLAQEAHVENLVDFARGWDRQAPMLIHCWMGISRSPAAAMIAALALEPDQDDMELALRLREAAPSASPNPRLVTIGDAMLGRGGALVQAVLAIGRGAEASQGTPFVLTLAPEEGDDR
jgi:predicted protein tyrosine phosphatase